MSSSALRRRAKPCQERSSEEGGGKRFYFPDFHNDILEKWALMAQERLFFTLSTGSDEDRREYRQTMQQIAAEIDPTEFAAFYRQSLHCLKRYKFLKTLLRLPDHLSNEAAQDAMTISATKDLQTPNGSLVVIATDGRVLMPVTRVDTIAPQSDLLPALVEKLKEETGEEVHIPIGKIHAPLYLCPESRLYTTYVTNERFAIPFTDTDMDADVQLKTHSFILSDRAKAKGYTYYHLIYSIVNPDVPTEISLVFSDGTESEQITIHPFEYADDEEADVKMMNDGLKTNYMDQYLEVCVDEFLETANPGHAKEIVEVIVTYPDFPFCWMTFPQVIVFNDMFDKEKEEHVARHLYFWFLYHHMKQEDLEDISSYISNLASAMESQFHPHAHALGAEPTKKARESDDEEDRQRTKRARGRHGLIDDDDDGDGEEKYADETIMTPRSSDEEHLQAMQAEADIAQLLDTDRDVLWGYMTRKAEDDKGHFDRRDRRSKRLVPLQVPFGGQFMIPIYNPQRWEYENMNDAQLIQKYHNPTFNFGNRATAQMLGKGTYGQVYRICALDNCSYVLKSSSLADGADMMNSAVYEVTCHIIAHERAPNHVPAIYDAFIMNPKACFAVYEKADIAGGDLFYRKHYGHYRRSLTEIPMSVMRGVYEAFYQCWSKGCYHLDCRADNFLFSDVVLNEEERRIERVGKTYLNDWGICVIYDKETGEFLHFSNRTIDTFWTYILDNGNLPAIQRYLESQLAYRIDQNDEFNTKEHEPRDMHPRASRERNEMIIHAYTNFCELLRTLAQTIEDPREHSYRLMEQFSCIVFVILFFCRYIPPGGADEVWAFWEESMAPSEKTGIGHYEFMQDESFLECMYVAMTWVRDMVQGMEPNHPLDHLCLTQPFINVLIVLLSELQGETMTRRINIAVNMS